MPFSLWPLILQTVNTTSIHKPIYSIGRYRSWQFKPLGVYLFTKSLALHVGHDRFLDVCNQFVRHLVCTW